jgi:hypothetical protein
MTDDVDNDPRDDRQAGKEKASAPEAPGDRQPDLKAAVAFLDAWHGLEPRHLTAIVPDGKATGRTFAADERQKLIEWCDEQQRRGAGLYYHVNVLNGSPRHGGKAGKAEIHSVRGAYVEIDLKDNFPDLDWRDDNKVAGALATVLERVKDFPITPTFVVLSGGGVQAGWRFDAPVNGGHMTRLETLNLALALHLGGDKSVRDVSRILRVPGTINFPNAKKRQLGRGSAISSCPILFDNAVNAKTLWEVIPDETRAQAEKKMAADRPSTAEPPPKGDRVEPVNVEAWINGLSEAILHDVSSPPSPTADRSEICFSLLLRLIYREVPDEVTIALRHKFPDGPLGHYPHDKAVREDLVRAHQRARQQGFGVGSRAAATATGEPPIPTIAEPDAGDEFPVEMLGPRLYAVVRAVARATDAPVDMVAVVALAVVAFVAQQHANVWLNNRARPISLLIFIIAISGERKTSVYEMLCRGLRAYERAEAIRLEKEREQYRIAKQVHDGQLQAISRSTKLDRAAREQRLAELGSTPKPPPVPGIIHDDATIEGLNRQMENGRVSQGLFSSDGGVFIGGHAMTKEALLRTLSGLATLNDVGMIHVLRADADRTRHVWGRRLAVCLMMQPGVAQRLLGSSVAEDQGALGRIMATRPKSRIGERINENLRDTERLVTGASDEDVIDAVMHIFSKTLRAGLQVPVKTDDTGGIDLPTITPTATAEAMLMAFGNEIERSMRDGQPNAETRAFGSKVMEHSARVATVLQIFDVIAEWCQECDTLAAGDAARPTLSLPTVVDPEHMGRGIAIARFFLSEMRRLIGEPEEDASALNAVKLEKWLTHRGVAEITLREIVRRGPKGLRSTARAREAVRILVENGRLISTPHKIVYEGYTAAEGWKIARDR